MNEWETCIDEWAGRLREANATIADLQGQVADSEKAYQEKARLWIEQTGAVSALQHRVAQLEGALERVANVPVDGDGRDYYWEGRDIAKQAIGKPTSERYTSLQADHARVLELVQEIKEAFDGDVHQCERCGEADPLNTFDIYRTVCEAASLPAQPAQGGAPVYSEEDLKKWWVAKCPKCGWEGLSRDCGGGYPIADTGDFDDPTCPKCDTIVD